MTETRQEYNIRILKELTEYFNKHPDMRFFQGLHALSLLKSYNTGTDREVKLVLNDNFYEESSTTYKNLVAHL
jgi:hypothetical protein